MQSTPSEPAPSDSSIIRAGTDGRLRFTRAQRQELLDAFDRSGVSAMAFARGHGVCYQTFIAWQRKRRERPTLPTTHSGPAFAPTNFPEIVLPFAGRMRRLRLEKMAYNLTARSSGKSAMRPKNRVWDFSQNGCSFPIGNRRRCPDSQRNPRPTLTIFTPGIPQWPSRDPIGEEGGVNLYGFVYSSPGNWIDFLGLDPLPPRPLTSEELKARATQEERSEAFRRAMRGLGGDIRNFDNILWEIIQKREGETGVVIKDVKTGACDCGTVKIQTRPGINDAPKPWDKSSGYGEWIEIKSDAGGLAAFDSSAIYNLAVFGGTCDKYSIRIGASVRREDAGKATPDLSRFESDNFDVKPGEPKPFNGKKGGDQRPLNVSRINLYEVNTLTEDGRLSKEWKHLVVKISVSGFRSGSVNACCVRDYYIEGK